MQLRLPANRRTMLPLGRLDLFIVARTVDPSRINRFHQSDSMKAAL
jgi:hypothetical protein